MDSTIPDTPADNSGKSTGILRVDDQLKDRIKILLAVVLLVGMIYGVLIWAEILPSVL